MRLSKALDSSLSTLILISSSTLGLSVVTGGERLGKPAMLSRYSCSFPTLDNSASFSN